MAKLITQKSQRHLRLIDTHSGRDVLLGETLYHGDGWFTILRLREGLFKAEAYVRSCCGGVQREGWQPLIVRWFHPSFFAQKIGFVLS